VADSERADIAWRKSMASVSQGDCVEVAFAEEAVLVRNSQDPFGPMLSFSYSEWAAFLTGARRGEFDAPDIYLSAKFLRSRRPVPNRTRMFLLHSSS
jgi:Domain of unknown function (DUF397)